MCPFNIKFARELKVPEFAPREFLAGKDARTLARDFLAMMQEEFSAAFKGSPMKRAKRRGLKRNSAVVLGNAGTDDDVTALAAALSGEEPVVRGHAAWALGRIASPAALEALRTRGLVEPDPLVLSEIDAALARVGA